LLKAHNRAKIPLSSTSVKTLRNMKNTSARARATTKSAAKKSAAATSRATQKVKPITKSQGSKTQSVAKSKAPAKASGTGSTLAVAPATKKLATPKVAVASSKAVRATKKRAPKDLAAQYGEKEKTPRKAAAVKAPRRRRDAAARARLQEVIAPDDALLLRLARAGAIASSLAPASAGEKPLRTVKTRRPRQWEAHCGKCGKSAFYRASAALCAGCGTILVREK
jgi:hypothetical protein